jgi:flagellar basal body-associated protein FliL
MAEKPDKKPESPAADKSKEPVAAPATKAGGGGLLTKTPVLLGGVMLLEAVVLFAGFKFLGSGAHHADGADLVSESSSAHGEKGEGKEGEGKGGAVVDKKKVVEVPVLDFKAPNKQSGRTFLYDVNIVAVSKGEFEEKVKTNIKDHESLIKDRVRTIIAQSDPEKLGGGSEPGLETLRRQVKYQLDEILGEGMVDEVLIPRCIPFRTDY